jgi:hypothetical protein
LINSLKVRSYILALVLFYKLEIDSVDSHVFRQDKGIKSNCEGALGVLVTGDIKLAAATCNRAVGRSNLFATRDTGIALALFFLNRD